MIRDVDAVWDDSGHAARYRDRWCYLGGGSKSETQTSNQTASNTINPQSLALLTGNLASAKANADTLTPYTGPLTAGFTQDQLRAQNALNVVGNDQSGQSAINTASGAVNGVLNTPINGNINYNPITASQLATTDLTPYLNPFTNDVINSTISDQERAREQAINADAAKATAAGAFGGSRSGVLSSLTNEAYDRNTGDLLANLRSSAFTNAQGAAQSDIAAQNAAKQFNANNDITSQQDSFTNTLNALGLKLNSAGQLVSTANAGLSDAATRAGILSAVGDSQQANNQTADTAAYNEFLRQQGFGATRQGILNSALGLVPVQQTATTSGNSSGTSKSSGDLFGGILGLISGGAKLGSAIYGGGA